MEEAVHQRVNLFVYGTLRRGQQANPMLKSGKLLKSGMVLPKYTMYTAGLYPFAVRTDKPDDVLIGDLYDIPTRILPMLDQYEGVPTMYERVFDTDINAFIYIKAVGYYETDLKQVTHGDWLQYKKNRA